MQRYKMMGVRAAAVIGGLALLGAGCNPLAPVQEKIGENISEGLIENAAGGKADVELGAKLQANFPEDVPRYPNARYTASVVQRDGEIAIANFMTDDEPQAVRDWFDAELTRGGFALDTDIDLGTIAKIYKNGDVTITLQIQATNDDDGKSVVSIQRVEKK